MPSNGVIAKILLPDRGLLFEGKQIENVIISEIKRWKLAQKRTDWLFMDLGYLPTNDTVENLHIMILTYFFKVNNLKF